MSDQNDTPEVDPEDIKAAEKAAGIETVPEGAEDLPPKPRRRSRPKPSW